MTVVASITKPFLAATASRPGCGKSTISGLSPPSRRMLMDASNSLEPSYWMSMPVAVSKALMDSSKRTASWSVNGPDILTTLPFNLPAYASTSSWPILAGSKLSAGVAGSVAGALVGSTTGALVGSTTGALVGSTTGALVGSTTGA